MRAPGRAHWQYALYRAHRQQSLVWTGVLVRLFYLLVPGAYDAQRFFLELGPSAMLLVSGAELIDID